MRDVAIGVLTTLTRKGRLFDELYNFAEKRLAEWWISCRGLFQVKFDSAGTRGNAG